MRNKKRIKKILKLFEELWLEHPDMRFFQLLINYSPLINYKKSDPWFYEDDYLQEALEFQVKQIVKKKRKKTKERC